MFWPQKSRGLIGFVPLRERKLPTPNARAATRKALKEIARKPNETITAAAARLIDEFRASTVDRDPPHASEITFFRRYIPENYFQNLMSRLRALVAPDASEWIVQKATVVVLIHQAGTKLELRPVVPHDPRSTSMRERGTVTHRIFSKLADTLAVGEEDEPPFRVHRHEDADRDEAPGNVWPKKARTA